MAELSPKYALEKNKDEWLKLFRDNAQVVDPVGAPSHKGLERISLFFDTFIKSNEVVFTVHNNWVNLDTEQVFRDIDITTEFGVGGIHVQPVHLRYTFREGKVLKLEAFWNFFNGCKF